MRMCLPRGSYFGRNVRSREVAGLILTEKVHPMGERTPPHAHAQPYLCLVIEGTWEEQFDGGARRCAPRTVIYHPPGEVHWDHFKTGQGRVFAIELDEGWRDRTGAAAPVLEEPRVFEAGAVHSAAFRIYDESRRRDDASGLVIEGLMLELLGVLARTRTGLSLGSAPAWLRRVEEIINDEFRTPPPLHRIAATVGVHPVHLARAFRTRHGCGVAEYVARLRVEHACVAMANRGRSLSDIAMEVGFFDQSHFTKAFRRITGATPARYRASLPAT